MAEYQLYQGKNGEYYVKNPESGEIYSGALDAATQALSSGSIPATPEDIEQSELRASYDTPGGVAQSALYGAVREGIPFLGDDVLEMFGVSENEQRAAIDTNPFSSAIGGIGGGIASLAIPVAGAAGRVAKATQVFGRLANAGTLARGAAAFGRGAAEGAFLAAGASESARIGAGLEEGQGNLARDLFVGAAFGGTLSLIGSGISAAIAGRTATKTSVSKATDRFLDSVSATEKKALSGEIASKVKEFRRMSQAELERELQILGGWEIKRTANLGSADIAKRVSSGDKRTINLMEKLLSGELERRVSVEALAGGLKSLGSKATGVAGLAGAGLGFAGGGILTSGGGWFLANAISNSPIVGRMGVKAAELGSKALHSLLEPSTQAITRGARRAVTTAVAHISAENYKDIRDSADNPIPAPQRIQEFVNLGVEPEVAADIVARQDMVLEIINTALPKTRNPRPEQLAKANRYVDALLNPKGVLDRMKDGQLTREDTEVLQMQSPEVMDEIRNLIAEQYENGAAFAPSQRAQHDIIGVPIGVSASRIQQIYAIKEEKQKKQLQFAEGVGTTMDTLEV